MFHNFNSLGFNNPYYIRQDQLVFKKSFTAILGTYSGDFQIDLTAVHQVLNLNFMLGERTLIKDVYKSPWMAKPNDALSDFDFFKIQKHGLETIDATVSAAHLYALLRSEVKSYVQSYKKIGILLSGGMDSRMVAGVLNDLILDNEVAIDSVTAYTWGNLHSRDVVYAEKICKKLGWVFQHYQVTAADLWDNIRIAAFNGCEYSGFHLHALPQIVKDLDVDIMLAGSFGDSIGRGEYSGKKVAQLEPLLHKRKNFAHLLDEKSYEQTFTDWDNDLKYYHQRFKEDIDYQQSELDYQIHYMRRMLNPCIGLLSEKCEVFQVFSSPEVFQYMWSIAPNYRTDDVYTHLLKHFKTDLSDIPWARTGLLYGVKEGMPDDYKKKHHSYSEYIHHELLPKMEAEIQTGYVFDYVDQDCVLAVLKMVKKYPNYNFDYLERLTWLASFSIFLREYNARIFRTNKKHKVAFNSKAISVSLSYFIIHFLRKIKARKLF